MLKEGLKVIESRQDVDNILADKHKDWQEQALQDCKEVKDDIIDKKGHRRLRLHTSASYLSSGGAKLNTENDPIRCRHGTSP